MRYFTSNKDIQAAKHKQFLFSMALFKEKSKSYDQHPTLISTTKSNLYNILIKKNSKLKPHNQSSAAQAWLTQKGFKKSTLIKKIIQEERIKENKISQKQQDIDLNQQKPALYDMEKYITLQLAHNIQTISQKIMKKSNLSTRILKKATQKYRQKTFLPKQSHQKQEQQIKFLNIKTKDKNKRQMYVQAIKQYGKKCFSQSQLVNHFDTYTGKKFWKIMAKHVNCVHVNEGQAQKSLKLIQQQFAAELPSGSESLKQYLSTKFLAELQNRKAFYLKDHHHGSLWGTVFLYYRAGLIPKLVTLIPNDTFLTLLLACQQSLLNHYPITKFYNKHQNDIFKLQLIHTLNGDPYWEDGLGNDDLGLVWVAIRNLGVFYQTRNQEMRVMKGKMIEFYQREMHGKMEVAYYLQFLLAYDQIAIRGNNQIIDQDDYIHFLICLVQNPILCDQNIDKINVILKKQLSVYIKQLINQQNPNYIYYLTLYPSKYQAQQIAFILSSSNKIINFDWSYLKNNIEQKGYKQIVQKTVSKYQLLTNYSLQACDLYYSVALSGTKAIESLLKHIYKHYTPSKQSLYLQKLSFYTSCDPALHQQYCFTLNFLISHSKLSSHLSPKYTSLLLQIIQTYSPSYTFIELKYHKLFQNLILFFDDGILIYFRFLVCLLNAIQIVLQNDNVWKVDQNHRKTVYHEIRQHLNLIIQYHPYNHYKTNHQYIQLASHINSVAFSIQYY